MSQSSPNQTSFNDTLASNRFHKVTMSSARITESTSRVIDLFITNTYAYVDVADRYRFLLPLTQGY